MPNSSVQKDINTLRRIIEKDGFKVVPSGSGHWRVLDRKGAVIVDQNGPVILSGTSSEIRGRDMAVNRLMAAGILKRDPWAPTPKKEGDRDVTEMDDAERAAYEREMEARRTEDQERSRRTLRIRERFEPIVARLGGWEKRGLVADIGAVLHYYTTRQELPNAWTSAKAASENAIALRGGATLSEGIASLWEHALGELEAWPDTVLRWTQLLREAKGIDPPSIGSEPFTRSTPASAPSPQTRSSIPAGELPTLALRAMFEMGVGRPAHDPDRTLVLKLGEEILRLELAGLAEQTPREE